MAGDFRDPMVGRDILVGGILGLCHSAAIYLQFLVPHWLGFTVQPNSGLDSQTLLGFRGYVAATLFALAVPVFWAVATPFLLLLLLAILRKKILAVIALWLLVFFAEGLAFSSSGPLLGWISPLIIATAFVISIARFGLLAHYSFFLFWVLSFTLPITANFSKWYAGATLFSFIVIMGLSIYGFYLSLAGQPLFKGKLLED